MKGENCVLSVPEFGERNVIVERLSHGMKVFGYGMGEGESRHRRTMYTYKRSSGSFDLDLVFPTYADYESTMAWLVRYGKWASNPYGNPAAMNVNIPSRDFNKNGVLTGGITFGDEAKKFVYRVSLSFMGASSALDYEGVDRDLISGIDPSVKGDSDLARLYPSNVIGGGIGLVDMSKDGADFGNGYGAAASTEILEYAQGLLAESEARELGRISGKGKRRGGKGGSL